MAATGERVAKMFVDLVMAARSSEWGDKEQRRAFLSWAVPLLVNKTYRNDNPIEHIHAGRRVVIPEGISRISDEEMREIMMAAVNNLAMLLDVAFSDPALLEELLIGNEHARWNRPDWEEIDRKREEFKKIWSEP